jgi:predicted NAD-dependent protein-ADP-ribosyltransferase YbiA (DUF1768 family)
MITFYAPDDPHGHYSNFSRHVVDIYDRVWMTSEHPFQAMKFHPHRPDLMTKVFEAPTPGKSAKIGRDRSLPLRTDWDMRPVENLYGDIPEGRVPDLPQPDDKVNRAGVKAEPIFARTKDLFMFEVVKAKFTQHDDLRRHLLETGDHALVEDAQFDPYWGWGASKIGENKLGRILMMVRSVIR